MPSNRQKHKTAKKAQGNLVPLWLALAGLLLIAGALFVFLNNGHQTRADIQVKGAPRLSVEKTTIDHGNVRLGTPIRDEVRVTNIGDQPLRFSEAPYLKVLEGC